MKSKVLIDWSWLSLKVTSYLCYSTAVGIMFQDLLVGYGIVSCITLMLIVNKSYVNYGHYIEYDVKYE
jgi:hypothetical protein